MKSIFIIAMIAVAIFGMMIPSTFAQYTGNVGSAGETGSYTLEEALEIQTRRVASAESNSDVRIELVDISILKISESSATIQFAFEIFNLNSQSMILQTLDYQLFETNFSNYEQLDGGTIGSSPEGMAEFGSNYYTLLGNNSIILQEKITIINNQNGDQLWNALKTDTASWRISGTVYYNLSSITSGQENILNYEFYSYSPISTTRVTPEPITPWEAEQQEVKIAQLEAELEAKEKAEQKAQEIKIAQLEAEQKAQEIKIAQLEAERQEVKIAQLEAEQKAQEVKITQLEAEQNGGGCLIATATYGSELSPQVQQLRELRDNQLLQTESGTAFMGTFNDIYYSFSPIIADYERENPLFKEVVKIAITPMISSLSLMENAESESEVLGMGLSVIMLNIGMYFGVPAVVIVGIRKIK